MKNLSLKEKVIIAIIIIFHAVGYVGFSNEALTPLFLKLVPVHLLLMFGLMLWSNTSWNFSFARFCVTIFLTSMLVESLGTNTGLIFGPYTYGKTLGWQVWNTPVLIAVNWLILVYSAGVAVQTLRIKNDFLSAGIAASMLTFIDYFLEPMAIRFDYWTWTNGSIPVQNYVSWFIVAFLFSFIFRKSHFNKQNPAMLVLLSIQLLFFILLA